MHTCICVYKDSGLARLELMVGPQTTDGTQDLAPSLYCDIIHIILLIQYL